MIALLQPFFPGAWAPYGESLRLDTAPLGATAHALLTDDAQLAETLARYRQFWSGADPRAVASAWSLNYLWALLPPLVAAASGARQVLPAACNEMGLELDAHGGPKQFSITHLGQAEVQGDTWARYDALVWGHLAPLADALSRVGRLPRKTLWSGAVRYLEVVLSALTAMDAGSVAATDQRRLLGEPGWGPPAAGRANPLCMPLRWSRGADTRVELYRECCLYHLLPGHGYCAACPLAPEHRACAALSSRASA